MENLGIKLIIIACVVVAGILVFIIINQLKKRKNLRAKEAVLETSVRYKMLQEINKNYKFYPLNPQYSYAVNVDSKKKFDTYNYDQTMNQLVQGKLESWKTIIAYLSENQERERQYLKEKNSIHTEVPPEVLAHWRISEQQYLDKEEEIFQDNIQRPVIDIEYTISASYTSPQGRNYYTDQRAYRINDIQKMYVHGLELQEARNTKEAQRRKLTPSLRYDIMKRDGFKCVLCGRSANDGVQLEVDHIIPVSKGGKTEESNLRTLCWDCNRGKRAKIEDESAIQ